MPRELRNAKLTYRWAPSASTPSVRTPLAELPQILANLRSVNTRRVADFGSGNGRNARALAAAFDRVYLVEDQKNVARLRAKVEDEGLGNCTVLSSSQFEARRLKLDAILVCCVLHTVPGDALRRQMIRVNLNKLRTGGRIVLVSPKQDPKYRPTLIADAVHFVDGIARLHAGSRTFSFYRNYNQTEFESLINSVGLVEVARIRSARRYIYVTEALHSSRNRPEE